MSNNSLATNQQVFNDLVNAELRNQLQDDGSIDILWADVELWVNTLLSFKGNLEVQFANMAFERQEQVVALHEGQLTKTDFNAWMRRYYRQRVGKVRFLKSIEAKIAEVNLVRKRAAVQDSRPSYEHI